MRRMMLRALEKLERLTPYLQATILFLAYIAIINDLNLKTNITINRITRYKSLSIYFPLLKEIIVILATTITAINIKSKKRIKTALFTISLVILYLAYIKQVKLAIPTLGTLIALLPLINKREKAKESLKELGDALSIILIIVCSYSTIRYLTFFFIPNKPFSEPSWAIAEIHLKLIHSLQPIIMITYTIIPLIPLIKWGIKKTKLKKYIKEIEIKEIFSRKTAYIILWLSILIAALQNTLPYLPTVNPRMVSIGVDVFWYEKWMREVLKGGIMETFYQADGSRPLYLLTLYATYKTLNLPLRQTIELMPTILLPLLIMSTFYMTLKLTKNYSCAALSSFLTTTGIQTTVGLYASFQANILALSLVYFSIGLIYSNTELKKLAPTLFSIYLIAELLHPSIVHILIVLSLYILLNKKVKEIKYITILFSTIAGTLTADIIKSTTTLQIKGTTVSVAQRTFVNLLYQFVENFKNYWTTSYKLASLYYGGFMTWPILLSTALLCLYNLNREVEEFINPWTITLLAIYVSEWGLYSRLVFNTPLQVALSYILIGINKKNVLYIILLISSSISYAFMCAMNLIWYT